MKKIEITLKKSIIGISPKQLKNINSLGLKKINQKIIKENVATIRGILKKIQHLVLVKEIIEIKEDK
ncbi:50S ribosomal protein L30 [Candidatus Phytoplasma pini]|uniref:50S ribosomal protein L30 n=1 Tax=Candidatus Phytoplasma pini TaxID=267362 RepID=A0A559KJN6_9MOLU|nr:50S ribosomal protein L30 [Candidatus Phytoplasma pini]TVY12341.1 50S ribosomal protein L30 [Candidatus Phytoplasma pini]